MVPMPSGQLGTPDSGIYRRCDAKGCDSYQPVKAVSGEYLVLSYPPGGLVAKISSRGEILEVTTSMTTAFVKHGECVAAHS